MQSLKLTIAYDGTNYCGWQMQLRRDSIQGEIQKAFGRILSQRVAVTASGRTDAGVHAIGQVASCQIESSLSPEVLLRALNSKLPPDIRITNIEIAREGFHAIADAQRKTYRYRIWRSRSGNVFLRNHTWHVYPSLDLVAMEQGLRCLQGTHDFASFQGAGSPRKTTVRTMYDVRLTAYSIDQAASELLAGTSVIARSSEPRELEGFDEGVIDITLEANGFLYNMVRNIVGTLVEIGKGHRDPSSIPQLIASRDRTQAGITAPPQGLTLLRVQYADDVLADDVSNAARDGLDAGN